jgi:fatty acid CoA ligase FadD9
VVRDPVTGRSEQRLLPAFDTITYGELWSNVTAMAAAWTGDDQTVHPGNFVATIGFASAEYLTVDLVCNYLGLVSVPLQHNSTVSRLAPIFAETHRECWPSAPPTLTWRWSPRWAARRFAV